MSRFPFDRNRGYDGVFDRWPTPRRFWNKTPDKVKEQVVDIALAHTEKSPGQLAGYITDKKGYFISESSVYRILKSYDLVTSPHHILLSAKDKFDKPPNE